MLRRVLAILTMLAVASAAIAAAAAGPSEAPAKRLSPRLAAMIEGVPDEAPLHVIVLTHVSGADGAGLARALGIETEWTYDIIDGFSARTTVGAARLLAQQPWVETIEDSRPVQKLMDVAHYDVRADHARTAGWDGSGITIAVLDTGIDQTDNAFAGAIVKCVSTFSAIVVPECDDTDGHGTHVAATAAGRSPLYRAIAPAASLAVVRVLHAGGAGLSTDIIAGMNWVGNNKDLVTPKIRVATMSIGYENPGCGNGLDAMALAADALVAKNVSFTIAAGNSGHSSCTVDGASAAFNVITVGAVDDRATTNPADDTLASFSSGGPTTDGRLKPEIVAPGVSITTNYIGPLLGTLSGTSMATPMVAGAIADLLEKEPTLSTATIKTRLTSSASAPTAAPALPDNDWGNGLLDVCEALNLATC